MLNHKKNLYKMCKLYESARRIDLVLYQIIVVVEAAIIEQTLLLTESRLSHINDSYLYSLYDPLVDIHNLTYNIEEFFLENIRSIFLWPLKINLEIEYNNTCDLSEKSFQRTDALQRLLMKDTQIAQPVSSDI